MKPVFTVGTVHYAWIKHRNIYGNTNILNNIISRRCCQTKS